MFYQTSTCEQISSQCEAAISSGDIAAMGSLEFPGDEIGLEEKKGERRRRRRRGGKK